MASESLAQKAMENVGGDIRAQSAAEPPSGLTGQGTTNSPYDGGNAPDNTPRPGVEPPSGQQGTGTVSDPYDAGNAPENASNVPQGNMEHPTPTGFPEHQGSGAPQAEPDIEEAQAVTASKNEVEQNNKATNEKFEKSTGVTPDGGNFEPATTGSAREAKRKVSEQRDISPGTLPDGSHAQTAGARGEVYEQSKMSKFKNKLGFGKT